MKSITFIDTEIDQESGKILDIGAVKENGAKIHTKLISELTKFLHGSQYICGHNIIQHDLKYIYNATKAAGVKSDNVIDTLHLSPLLFPKRPYHALLKDDKLQTDELNNPINDCLKTRDLFHSEVAKFAQIDRSLKRIYYYLLKDTREFRAFFDYIGYYENDISIEEEIYRHFQYQLCENVNLSTIVERHPIELAYCLALINSKSRYSITPPWVLRQYPEVERLMFLLRNNPCIRGCKYCNEAMNAHKGLKQFFGFDSFRKYAGEPLQEKAVKAAIANKSLLAVFPTGGGKSITFQVPALMSGMYAKGLTVVISPLQSLMKDQVDNLERIGITDAVTINGLLDPIERAKSYERVENGSASILYISPESLRSKTIERLLLGRNVVRFVIDEAHCFSSWGQDFRVDYLYIGDFIRALQERKNMEDSIPVSCFTATAKQKVIQDICDYFKAKLNIEMEVFSSNASRSNLRYKVIRKENEEEKYNAVRDLIEYKNCPTIIYVSRTRRARELAERLNQDGYQALAYHGKMNKQDKTVNQDAFIRGDVQIMVATSAFGMGVDKKDVGMVIHYDISDSLENYIQEAGRAGRDESISADCYVLYNDDDLSKHFILLNQTKLSIQEIQQIWKAIKDITKLRSKVSQSALEIARKAGWDDSIAEIETRVTTAIAALEEAGYLRRGQNMPRVFANSILAKNAQEAIEKINASSKFDDKQRVQAIRIIKKMISSKSRRNASDEVPESRVDYISDHLGIVKEDVIRIIQLLREERILADTKDLTVFIKKKEHSNRSLNMVQSFSQLETFLLSQLIDQEQIVRIKELNEKAEEYGCKDVTPHKIKTIFTIWAIKNWIKQYPDRYSKSHIHIQLLHEKEYLQVKIEQRHALAQFIVEYLFEKMKIEASQQEQEQEEILVEFSVLELKEEYEHRGMLLGHTVTLEELEDALFYLSRIEALKIEGGFLVIYNALTIERLELDNKRRYRVEDYQKLEQFYQNKVQQIHIVGEYARKMIEDYKAALQFVDDYFRLVYTSFINKYFKGSRQDEIRRNITPTKFKQLFGDLSPTQLKIINDNHSKYIVVAAGPGSGKTRILVHKLASLLLMEDVKHEQLLMLTFSRAAVTEFKKRLLKLIGNAANFIEIKTFHSYCFDLLGRIGTLEKSEDIIQETIKKIKSGEVEANRITKAVLVIDEAQDMDDSEFALIRTLMEQNEEMRVIAVGDDDQNIFAFRGASSKHLHMLIQDYKAVIYELVENYRSKSNLVEYANQFVKQIKQRLKNTPSKAVQNEVGTINIVRYRSDHLIDPVVNEILAAPLTGSTCVLTTTNDEALQVTGLLVKNGIQAKLIQSNDSVSVFNLVEVRFFLQQIHRSESVYIIDDEIWLAAKRKLMEKFRKSANLEVCLYMLKDFEATHPKVKYVSDLEIFIRESKMEDFFTNQNEAVIVSTIHKAKGREFDNVFLMLDRFDPTTDEAKRLLYVAITRAKQRLSIHYNGNYLDLIKVENITEMFDSTMYTPPDQIAIQLSYKDVWLDAFINCQHIIAKLNAGDTLIIDEGSCLKANGHPVVKFSKQFIHRLAELRKSSYYPKSAIVKYIVYWYKENAEREILILLPELHFEKLYNH